MWLESVHAVGLEAGDEADESLVCYALEDHDALERNVTQLMAAAGFGQ